MNRTESEAIKAQSTYPGSARATCRATQIQKRHENVNIANNQTVRHADSLADLPIDVAEAMYSPDFVELSSLSAGSRGGRCRAR